MSTATRRTFPRTRRLAGWFALALLVGGAVAAAAYRRTAVEPNRTAQTIADDKSDPLTVEVFRRGEVPAPELWARYRGDVRPRRESPLAFRRPGRVAAVRVDVGDVVRAGDVLAELEMDDLDAAEAAARAAIAAAQAALDEALAGPRPQTIQAAENEVDQWAARRSAATTRLQRLRQIDAQGASSQQAIDDAKYAAEEAAAAVARAEATLQELKEGTRSERIAAARANFAAAQADLQRVQVNRVDSQVIAPYDGVVTERLIDEGTVVGPNQMVCRVIEAAPFEVRFGVPIEVANRMEVNQTLDVSIGNIDTNRSLKPQRTEAARVLRIEPRVDRRTRTRGVDVLLDDRSVAAPGQTATLWVPARWVSKDRALEDDDEAFWVPVTALARGVRGLWSVYVVQPTAGATSVGVVRRRDVRVQQTAGALAQVQGSVATGELIVATGTTRIGPGVRVRWNLRSGQRDDIAAAPAERPNP